MSWLDGLFGESQPNLGFLPPGATLDPAPIGLLDPRAIRAQAAFQGLGALSAGLLAAGQRRPAMQPSPLPQALLAYPQAYNQGIQSGIQSAALDTQAQDQQRMNALRASDPRYANLPTQALIAQASRPRARDVSAMEAQQRLGANYNPSVSYQETGEGRLEPVSTPSQQEANTMARVRVEGIQRPGQGGGIEFPYGMAGGSGMPAGGAPSAMPGQGGVPNRAPPTNPGGLIVPGSGTGPDNPIRYQSFDNPQAGLAAADAQLLRNAQRIQAAGQPVTLQTLIGGAQGIAGTGWAPGGVHGNDPATYVANLTMRTGFRPDQPLDIANPQVRQRILDGIVRQEGVAGGQAQAQAAPLNPVGTPSGQTMPQLSPEAQAYFGRAQAPTAPANPVSAVPNTGQVPIQGRPGVTVSRGPNGSPWVSIGAPPDAPSPSNQSEIQQAVIQGTERLGRLQEIAGRFNPEWLTYSGQLTNWGRGFLERLGADVGPEARRQMAAYESFRSTVADEFNNTLRALSGAAVTPSELARMQQSAPNLNDSPTQFQSKLQATIESVALANARRHYMLSQGIRPTFTNDSAVIPLSQMRGIIDARGTELERTFRSQGLSEGAARARVEQQLRQEFGMGTM